MRRRTHQLAYTGGISEGRIAFGLSLLVHFLVIALFLHQTNDVSRVVSKGYQVSLLEIDSPANREVISEAKEPIQAIPKTIQKAPKPAKKETETEQKENKASAQKVLPKLQNPETKTIEKTPEVSPSPSKTIASAVLPKLQEKKQFSPKTPNIQQSKAENKEVSSNTKTSQLSEAKEQPIIEKAPDDTIPPAYQIGSKNNPTPNYPKFAKAQGHQGDVVLGVHVNADGSIRYLEILDGAEYSTLNFSAWNTVKNEWTFEPAMKDEVAIAGYVEVLISFK